ncbi:uncharacterized protein LOC141913188 [Tubulanus polymorphus]|uniref:uncharacterized protein LOC141913188 n=1 Tax=Tubulanus polymorphus TaxID=672921 RepID=UPI003DA1D509
MDRILDIVLCIFLARIGFEFEAAALASKLKRIEKYDERFFDLSRGVRIDELKAFNSDDADVTFNRYKLETDSWVPFPNKTTSCTDELSHSTPTVDPDQVENYRNQERKFLLKLHKAWNGEYWTNKWNLSTVHCSWSGIECDRNGLVMAIRMSLNNVTGRAISLHPLNFLKAICIIQNDNLYGRLEDFFQLINETTSLERITLSYNDLSGDFGILGRFQRLKFIQISANYFISGEITTEFCELIDLLVFSVGETKIGGLIPRCFGYKLTKVRYLDIEYCDLDAGPIPNGITHMVGLKFCHLSGANLQGQLPWNFGVNFSLAVEVSLTENNLTGHIPESFGYMTKLQILRLSYNQFEGRIPDVISNYSKLMIVDLDSNRLTGLPRTPFRSHDLRAIDLSDNPLNVDMATFFEIVQTNHQTPYGVFMQTAFIRCRNCGINGSLTSDLYWYNWAAIIDLSHNRLQGKVPVVGIMMWFLTEIYLNHNPYLIGALPPTFNWITGLRILDISHTGMRASSSHTQGLNPSLFIVDTSRLVQVKDRAYSCPSVRLRKKGDLPGSVLRLDPVYYGYDKCVCNPGYFGSKGRCYPCLESGTCETGLPNTTMSYASQMWPSRRYNPNYFLNCTHIYSGQPTCNPHGNCTCVTKIRNDMSFVECDSSCMCNPLYHLTGRKCSQCKPGRFYKDGYACYECIDLKRNWLALFGIIVSLIVLVGITLILWYKDRVLGAKVRWVLHLFRISFLVVHLLMATFGIVPTWSFELAVLTVLFGMLNQQNNASGIVKTFVFYIQTLSVTIHRFSITGIIDWFSKMEYYVKDSLNLRFSSFGCVMPWMKDPLGKLKFLVSIIPGFIFCLGVACAVRLLLIAKRRWQTRFLEPDTVQSFNEVKFFATRCFSLLLFVFDLTFYPIVFHSLAAIAPCSYDPSDGHQYMKAYQYIDCDSVAYSSMYSTGLPALIVYGAVCPVILCTILALINRKLQRLRQLTDHDLLNETVQTDIKCIEELISKLAGPFTSPHNVYMSSFFLLQKMLIALIFTLMNEHGIAQVVFLSVMYLALLFHQFHSHPFLVTGRFDLENNCYQTALGILVTTTVCSGLLWNTGRPFNADTYSTIIAIFVSVLNVLMVLIYVVCTIFRVAKKKVRVQAESIEDEEDGTGDGADPAETLMLLPSGGYGAFQSLPVKRNVARVNENAANAFTTL